MRRIHRLFIAILGMTWLASCASPTAAPTQIPSSPTAEPAPLPLSGIGPYGVGWRRMLEYHDPARQDRKVTLSVWYPAQTTESTLDDAVADAPPDLSEAPYPLVLSSTKMGMVFAPHLASYGFIVAGINGQDAADHWGPWLTDYPLDIVFALNQIAATPIEGLEGMIDADHAGAMGYSFDGYTSLALSGARVDPQFYRERCGKAASMSPPPPEWWIGYVCDMTGGWDAFVANAGTAITSTDDGLWKAITDPRIKAVIPMAPEGAWLFGDRGLAAADRSILIIAAGDDTINIYDLEAAPIFDQLGAPDRAMISFLGQGHMMVYEAAQTARMRHFAAAFFSTKLQQKEDFAKYMSEEFVAGYKDLAWIPPKNP
jgi:predicted dienelactone hydrolase